MALLTISEKELKELFKMKLGPRKALLSSLPPCQGDPVSCSYSVEQIHAMSVKEMSTLLRELHLSNYCSQFEDQEISGVAFLTLTEQDLKTEFRLNFGPFKVILGLLASFKPSSQNDGK
eukprot:TRINITY_DN4941_c1_g1_i1.p1 TRINITY_DN4941_c1_g1~~TRINITY_DN4941_c1_g1_i1.p1  ORF type:complete len:138 (+),score=27.85 TRINITY_DN4941_c1_g1_i1:58-414(+)